MECKEDEDTDTKVQEAEIKQDSADAEVVDVDLNDPELKAAASKIQASFRRFKTKQTIDADVPHVSLMKEPYLIFFKFILLRSLPYSSSIIVEFYGL